MGTSVTSDSFFQKVYIILTRPDGSIVYANTPYPNRKNFLSATLQGGIDSEKVESIQQVFERNQKKTISFLGKGNKYYMSWETFDFNDWRVVMFARSPDVVLQTTTILRGMIIGGVGLIVLTVYFAWCLSIFCCDRSICWICSNGDTMRWHSSMIHYFLNMILCQIA